MGKPETQPCSLVNLQGCQPQNDVQVSIEKDCEGDCLAKRGGAARECYSTNNKQDQSPFQNFPLRRPLYLFCAVLVYDVLWPCLLS